jgi:hypothetical protein
MGAGLVLLVALFSRELGGVRGAQALAVGLLSTPARRILWNRWFLVAGLIAFAVALPNLAWEIRNRFPHLEQLANIRRNGRNVDLGALGFLGQQVLGMHPLSLPLWGGGLAWTLFGRDGRPFRFLGIAWLTVLVLLLLTGGRFYYLFPAHPILLAAGATGLEALFTRWRLTWAGPAYALLLALSGAVLAPATVPILAPADWIAWSRATGLSQPRIENRATALLLPQLFADRCGWREMAEVVTRAYFALSPEERARTAIFGNDYGQAGAIDLYGPGLGLPWHLASPEEVGLTTPRPIARFRPPERQGARRYSDAPGCKDFSCFGALTGRSGRDRQESAGGGRVPTG